MCFFKKKEKEKEEKVKPIFPIYLNTMRIKDTIAILEDGITSMRSVTKDIINQKSDNVSSKGEGSLYSINVGLNTEIKNDNVSKHNEHFEKIHTDASLFYKILMEFAHNKRIKSIKCKEDLKDINEGQIVSCEGKISGNEIEAVFNKFYIFVDAMSAMGNKEARAAKQQLSGMEKVLTQDDKITDIGNMICQLDDGTDLIVVIENKYLLNDSGVELVRGKYKILGIVYEKVFEEQTVNLTRDSMLGLFQFEDVQKIYEGLNNAFASAKLEIPQVRTSISGPSVGIMPIGIYL